jgi:hypothetical protein
MVALAALHPKSISANLAHRRMAEVVGTLRQKGEPLSLEVLAPFIERDAFGGHGETALKGDLEVLGILFAHLPHDQFVDRVMRHANKAVANTLQGWMTSRANSETEVASLLNMGAILTTDIPGKTTLDAWMNLSRFPSTTSFFLSQTSRFPEWSHQMLSGVLERDIHEWLVNHACIGAFKGLLDSGAMEAGHVFSLGIEAKDAYGNSLPRASFSRGSERLWAQSNESMLGLVLRRLTDDGLDAEREGDLLAKAMALFEYGASQTHSGTHGNRDEDGFNILAGKPQQTTKWIRYSRASNHVIDALYPSFLKDCLDEKLNRLLLLDKSLKLFEKTEHGSVVLNRAIQTLLDQGARVMSSITGDFAKRDPAILLMFERGYPHPNASFEAVFDMHVPEQDKSRALALMLDRALVYTMEGDTRPNPALRWLVDKGANLDFFDGPGKHESLKFRLALKCPDFFAELVMEGRIDLDKPTYEGRPGQDNHAPLGVQIARLLPPDRLGILLDAGWDADRVFLCERKSLPLPHILAQSVDFQDRRDMAMQKAFNERSTQKFMEPSRLTTLAGERVRDRMERLQEAGVNFSRGGPNAPMASSLLTRKGSFFWNSRVNSFIPVIEDLLGKMRIWEEQGHIDLSISQPHPAETTNRPPNLRNKGYL